VIPSGPCRSPPPVLGLRHQFPLGSPAFPLFLLYETTTGLTLARLPTLALLTFKVAEDFVLPAVTASFSLRFTASLLAVEHFRLRSIGYGTACHCKLRRHRLWRPYATFLLIELYTDIQIIRHLLHALSIVDLAVFLYLGHSKNSWLID